MTWQQIIIFFLLMKMLYVGFFWWNVLKIGCAVIKCGSDIPVSFKTEVFNLGSEPQSVGAKQKACMRLYLLWGYQMVTLAKIILTHLLDNSLKKKFKFFWKTKKYFQNSIKNESKAIYWELTFYWPECVISGETQAKDSMKPRKMIQHQKTKHQECNFIATYLSASLKYLSSDLLHTWQVYCWGTMDM